MASAARHLGLVDERALRCVPRGAHFVGTAGPKETMVSAAGRWAVACLHEFVRGAAPRRDGLALCSRTVGWARKAVARGRDEHTALPEGIVAGGEAGDREPPARASPRSGAATLRLLMPAEGDGSPAVVYVRPVGTAISNE